MSNTAETTPGPETYCVLGDDQLGIAIAERLHAAGDHVTVVNERHDSADVLGTKGDPADPDTLTDAGVATADMVVVSTRSDRRNLLIAQLVRSTFDVPRIVVLVNDPDRHDLFAAAGHEPFCVTTALSEQLTEEL